MKRTLLILTVLLTAFYGFAAMKNPIEIGTVNDTGSSVIVVVPKPVSAKSSPLKCWTSRAW